MSQYTVSSSESSSFCTNAAPDSCTRVGTEHSESVVVSISKRTHMRPTTGAAAAGGVDEEAADAGCNASTQRRPLRSAKVASAKMGQESPSMTIRRVPVDYSKRIEDQKARSNALERYKMLVRGNQAVKCGRSSPGSVEVKEGNTSSAQRDGAQHHACTASRDSSAISEAVASGDAVAKEEELPLPVSQSRRSAGGPVSSSGSRRIPPSASSSSFSVPVDRPISPPADSAADKVEGSLTGDSTVPVVPQLNLSKVYGPSLQQTATCAADGAGDADVHYVAPELTQPYCVSSRRRRDSVRPGYEPVMVHERTSLHRTLSASFAQADVSSSTSSSQLQPRSQNDKGTSTTTRRASTSVAAARLSDQLTRRRKSDVAKTVPTMGTVTGVPPEQDANEKVAEKGAGEAAAMNITSESPILGDVAAQRFHDGETGDISKQVDGEEDGAEGHGAPAAKLAPEQGQEAILLPGSKTTFWLRPSTAMYEMTASIAAKRKDYHGDEEDVRRSPHRRDQNQSRSCAATASTASSCGTPRGRSFTTAEPKPRFTTHMTSVDRERYEETPAAVASATAKTYGTIYSARQSTIHMSPLSRLRQPTSTDASAVNQTYGLPHRTSQQQQRRAVPRVCSQRSSLERRPSTLSPLSSDRSITVSSAERHRAVSARSVSTRQQDSFTKHCARVAARNSRPEELTGAAAKPAKTTTVATSAGEAPAKGGAAVPLKPEVNKRLQFEVEAEPVPRLTVPQVTGRVITSQVEPKSEPTSPVTTIHGFQQPGEGSPCKSRRREHELTASPPRSDDYADLASRLLTQDTAVGLEEEEARVQQARAALESCRQACQKRMDDSRASPSTGASTSTNEVVAAMLQGIVQQTRQVLPCYLCADQQAVSAYRVHVDLCRPKTEALLREYYTTIDGIKDIPAALQERVQRMASQEVPITTSPEAVREVFAKECYQCVKAMLVACRKCGVHVRVHDVKEHEMLCGRACYHSSRAAERVRSTVERIEHDSQE
ncbi:hypothetical protein Q4I32_006737 [Leishmania shawi]|uniref:MYND-type domain-containing protein n=1 Tax=Leishmania shawi TaxID=5680 RepID=A0AAW3BEZ4_9TRYP